MDSATFMAMVTKVVDGDAAKLKVAEEIVAICGGITDSDRCELGHKLGHCLMSEGMKRKMEMEL